MEDIGSKILAKYMGGSHLYGMNGPNSDVDWRGVIRYNDPLVLLGFESEKPIVRQNNEEDVSYHSVNNFVRLLMKGNTEAMECIFNKPQNFVELDPVFEEYFLQSPFSFLHSGSIFNCFKGYMHGEFRLAIGERTGLLGSKRKAALDKYGFSPKNFSHLIRLCACGTSIFRSGIYPVRIKDYDKATFDLCMSIKNTPELWEKDQLVDLFKEHEQKFFKSYEHRAVDFAPDMVHIRKAIYAVNKSIAEKILDI